MDFSPGSSVYLILTLLIFLICEIEIITSILFSMWIIEPDNAY